jgi:arylsulfatase A-like enzyme
LLRQESNTDEPFFVFSNYMETHRPYIPDDELQQKHLGETLDWDELVRLNEEVAESWNFVELVEKGELDEEDVRKIQSLYAGEVETADRYLGFLLDELESQNLLDETLVVVTSDHGEMLGEEDALSRRRMGHQAAMSEHLSRVPLVISHPDMRHGRVDEYVSLKDLFGLFLGSAQEGKVSMDRLLHDGDVLCEYPALGDERMYEEHPNVSDEAIAQRVSQDSVSVHSQDWRVVANSDGDRVAEQDGGRIDIEDAPQDLVELAESSLDELSKLNKEDVDDETAARLEDLGYM